MNLRKKYALLYALPGLFIAIIVAGVLSVGIAGIGWIFIFGDNTWPSWFYTLTIIVTILSFLIIFGIFIRLGYNRGKRAETTPTNIRQDTKKIFIITGILLLLIFLQQVAVGNIGNPRASKGKSDMKLCTSYCEKDGYNKTSIYDDGSKGTTYCNCSDDKNILPYKSVDIKEIVNTVK